MNQFGGDRLAQPGERSRSSGVVVSLLVFVFVGFAAVKWQQRQVVESIEVKGASPLSRLAVNQVLRGCLRKQRQAVDLADLRENIERIPFVRNVHVYFDGVRTVAAEIRERYPVGQLVMPDGSLRYLDSEGNCLPSVEIPIAHDVPIVRRSDGQQLTERQRVVASHLLESARTTLDLYLYESISEVELKSGKVAVLRTSDGEWYVMAESDAGHAGLVSHKAAFENLNMFRRQLGQSSVVGTNLDLRWSRHVIVTRPT